MSQIISIEGNIGSGKSTILKYLKESLKDKTGNTGNIIFLQEPVDEWSQIKDKNNVTILEKFYSNQEKYSFAFQMMAYISRLSLLKNAIEKNPNAIIITERCLNTDRYVFAKMLYDSGMIEDVEYQIYLNWFDHFLYMQTSQKVIYLQTDPNICYYRINKRDREGESNISLEYLQKCHKYHEEMIGATNDQYLIIDSNIDTQENKNINDIWVSKIIEFIYKNADANADVDSDVNKITIRSPSYQMDLNPLLS
jgi:deoxyadenosine/deoxycytidine kinase